MTQSSSTICIIVYNKIVPQYPVGGRGRAGDLGGGQKKLQSIKNKKFGKVDLN